jgi:hypothetical protein
MKGKTVRMRMMLILIGMVFVASDAYAGRDCEAKYGYNNYQSNWYNLGEVSWPNRRNKCRNRASSRGDLALAALKAAVPNPPVNGCGSTVNVYFDTRVEGLSNSKDGNIGVRLGNPVAAVYRCDPGFTLQGSNCIQSKPAILVTPAGCRW